jgi:hypothetical protein
MSESVRLKKLSFPIQIIKEFNEKLKVEPTYKNQLLHEELKRYLMNELYVITIFQKKIVFTINLI